MESVDVPYSRQSVGMASLTFPEGGLDQDCSNGQILCSCVCVFASFVIFKSKFLIF